MDYQSPTRDHLVDVGVELLLTEGTEALGLREIARRAGISHGAPRRYFPTHKSLLSAIARRGFLDLRRRFEAVDEQAPAAEQLRSMARIYVGFAVEQSGMFELMFRHDLLASGPEIPDHAQLRTVSLPLFARAVELVARHRAERSREERQANGSMAADATAESTPEMTAAALWAGVHGVAQLSAWNSFALVLEADNSSNVPAELPRILADTAVNAHLREVDP